jgi:hypothetical protein
MNFNGIQFNNSSTLYTRNYSPHKELPYKKPYLPQGPELGAPSPAACDLMFITEADLMCLGDADCQLAAQRSIQLLRRSQIREEECQCCKSPCVAHHFLHTPLPVPIPAASSR